ncbi:hypothetical protein D3C83_92060 [compost metagenome]
MIDLVAGETSAQVAARCEAKGLLVTEWHDTRVRVVTHLDVDDAGVAKAGEILAEALAPR